MIRELTDSDISGLNILPPKEWNFDYESVLKDFFTRDYFYAFVLLDNERVIGTGNVLINGPSGWLGNIIVNENYRGKGLGSEMTKFLVDFLTKRGCNTQLLIATDLGKSVYQKLGFKEVTDYYYFDSEEERDFKPSKSIRKLEQRDLNQICELDKKANGENRAHLIEKYFTSGVGFFGKKNQMLGFYLPDYGRGLIISKDTEAGLELLSIKHSKQGSRTMLPIDNIPAIDYLEKSGFKKGDKCTRMILGKDQSWEPKFIFAIGSGFCG